MGRFHVNFSSQAFLEHWQLWARQACVPQAGCRGSWEAAARPADWVRALCLAGPALPGSTPGLALVSSGVGSCAGGTCESRDFLPVVCVTILFHGRETGILRGWEVSVELGRGLQSPSVCGGGGFLAPTGYLETQ